MEKIRGSGGGSVSLDSLGGRPPSLVAAKQLHPSLAPQTESGRNKQQSKSTASRSVDQQRTRRSKKGKKGKEMGNE